MKVEVVNTEQAAAWNGHEGDAWTEQADRYERATRRIWGRFVEGQLVGRADRVLDVGCGTGSSTRHIARLAPAGVVTGIDLSSQMLALARRKGADEGLDNVTFVQGDAQVFPFEPDARDIVVSSFGAMFFNDPVAAFTNIGSGLRPGGALALLAWRTLPENGWMTLLRHALAVGRELPVPPPDAPSPFALADPERVRSILEAACFDDVALAPIDEPVDLGTDASDALEFATTMGMVKGLTDSLDPDERAEAFEHLGALFREHETPDGVHLESAAWLITARKR